MQVFISSSFPSLDLFMIAGSAKKGRAIETISACLSAKTFSAISGWLILFVVIKGIDTSPIIFLVTQLNAALGTIVPIVGILASCQPIPVLIIVAPAFSISLANNTVSSHVFPPSTKSSIESLKIRMKFSPTAFRVSLMISNGNLILFSKDPPHWSVLLLVFADTNSLIRYPSEPIISTPS